MTTKRLPTAILGSELLILLASIAFVLFYCDAFWHRLLQGWNPSEPSTWLFAISTGIVLSGLNFLLLQFLANRWTTRGLVMILVIIAAAASYFSDAYGTYFDPTMIENVLETNLGESLELISPGLITHLLLFAALPIWLVSRVRLDHKPLRIALLRRLSYLVVVLFVSLLAFWAGYGDLIPKLRSEHELRHYIAPGNVLVSLARHVANNAKSASPVRIPLEDDAVASHSNQSRPRLLVLVVGETVRAANWGLNGYERQTTPELARRDVINYPRVTACGTSTAVSLPCLFSPKGDHADYDRQTVRQQESLLDVLANAGFGAIWIDNQSGCKGVCSGVEFITTKARRKAGLCDPDGCLDSVLLDELQQQLSSLSGDTVIVLHQLGNHGPAYYKRYPLAGGYFQPVCTKMDLGQCDREHIINAYDNAVRYTDSVLADLVDFLDHQQRFDTAMLYVSDHGESLGEKGPYLHGVRFVIAPPEQTQVPMVLWLSKSYAHSQSISIDCLRANTDQDLSHAHVFHTVLGMLGVSTSIYRTELDLTNGCRVEYPQLESVTKPLLRIAPGNHTDTLD